MVNSRQVSKGGQFLVQCGPQKRYKCRTQNRHHRCQCNDETPIISRVTKLTLQHIVTYHFKWEDDAPNSCNSWQKDEDLRVSECLANLHSEVKKTWEGFLKIWESDGFGYLFDQGKLNACGWCSPFQHGTHRPRSCRPAEEVTKYKCCNKSANHKSNLERELAQWAIIFKIFILSPIANTANRILLEDEL